MAHGARPVTAALLAGAAAALVVHTHRTRWAVATAALVAQPAFAVLLGLGWGGYRAHSMLRRSRLRNEEAIADVGLLAELVSLGLSAGLSLRLAMTAAIDYVHPVLRTEVVALLHRASQVGLAAALAAAEGHGQRLYLVTARAVATGAPLGSAVDAFARELAAEAHARQVAAAHRLPVRLMVPLALLILPGFVLLTVGPAVLAALDRIAFPV